MKNFIVLSVFVIASSAQAQSVRRPAAANQTSVSQGSAVRSSTVTDPSIQFKAGLGFGTISSNNPAGVADNIGSATGLNFAAMIDLPMNPTFSINTGLQFIQKGLSSSGQADLGAGVGSYKITTKVSYLEVPVLAKLNFGQKSVRFNIAAGPYAAFKIATSTTGTFSLGNGPSQDIQVESPNNISGMDFGLRAGVGTEFMMSDSLSFLVGADYDLGLKNVAPENVAEAKTRTFVANVGVGMRI